MFKNDQKCVIPLHDALYVFCVLHMLTATASS